MVSCAQGIADGDGCLAQQEKLKNSRWMAAKGVEFESEEKDIEATKSEANGYTEFKLEQEKPKEFDEADAVKTNGASEVTDGIEHASEQEINAKHDNQSPLRVIALLEIHNIANVVNGEMGRMGKLQRLQMQI